MMTNCMEVMAPVDELEAVEKTQLPTTTPIETLDKTIGVLSRLII